MTGKLFKGIISNFPALKIYFEVASFSKSKASLWKFLAVFFFKTVCKLADRLRMGVAYIFLSAWLKIEFAKNRVSEK